MISILLLVFLLQLAIHLTNTLGKQTVNDILWQLFTKLPTPQSREAAELAVLGRDVTRLKREMTATSAQDEFAKWAKLRRQHDKAKEKYDAKAQRSQAFRSNFDRVVSALRWLGTQGLQFVCNFWFSKRPMFWLAHGWMPYPAEWLLSFPRAPLGSVSVNVWTLACASVIGLASEAVTAVWTLKTGEVKWSQRSGTKPRMQGIAMESRGGQKEL